MSVYLVGADGEPGQTVSLRHAREVAAEAGLDLVQVRDGSVPVVRVMDYSRYRYEQQRKSREQARAARAASKLHHVRLRPNIDPHDYRTKLAMMQRFLQAGDKVKVSVTFRGRMINHPELGVRLLERLREDLAGTAVLSGSEQRGRDMSAVLTPCEAR